MDPLSHLSVGAATGLLAGRGRTALALAAVGSLLPDIEKALHMALAFLPGGHFLLFRGGGTHTLLGAALLCAALALLVTERPGRVFLWLCLGASTHLVLDLIQSPWSLRPFMPFSRWAWRRQDLPGVMVVHAALVLLALAVLAAGWRRARRGGEPASPPGPPP